MTRRIDLLVIFTVSVVILACGCMGPVSTGEPAPATTPTITAPLAIEINATPSRYSPVMSSTIGIRLTPVNTSGIIPPTAQFTWGTTFGSFYHWGPPDFKVIELGPEYTGTKDPVYWSYFSEHGEKERLTVNITLTVRGPATEGILANSSLRIGWEDPLGFTAIVEGSE